MIIEKTYVLKSSIPELATNGRIAVYQTMDIRVNLILVLDKSFEWSDRKRSECFRCPACNQFVLPDERSRVQNGVKYHFFCKPPRAKKAAPPEVEADPCLESAVSAI